MNSPYLRLSVFLFCLLGITPTAFGQIYAQPGGIQTVTGLNITPPAGLGAGLNGGQTMSGTATGTVIANVLQITSDTAAIPGFNSLQTLNVTDSFGGGTVTGGRHALIGTALLTAPTSPSNTFRDYVGVVGFAQANTGDGGTNLTTNPAGNFFGGSFYFNLLPGATNLGVASGIEVNSFAQTGSSLKNKNLIAMVGGGTQDQVAGSAWDAMLQFSRQTGGVGFQAGILFSDAYGAFPVPATGTLIEAFAGTTGAPTGATVANGIDFSHMTFTGCAANFGANGPSFCSGGASFGGAPVNQNSFMTMLSNVNAVLPPSATTTYSLSDNFNGFREMDLWNDDTAATQSFVFLQRTSGAAATLMAINPNGAMTLPGITTGTSVASVCVDSNNILIKKVGAC
jgi:hypothetical protein